MPTRLRLNQDLALSFEGEPGKTTRVWDTVQRGLMLHVNARGSKSWRVIYWTDGGRRQREEVLGRLDTMTCADARKAAGDVLARVAKGTDPLGDKQRERAAMTLAEYWARLYLPDRATRWKASTAAGVAQLWRTMIEPALGARRVADLTRAEIVAWHARESARPYSANSALRVLKAALARAVEFGLVASSPAAGVKPFKEKARVRWLTDEETACLMAALEQLEAEGADTGPGRVAPTPEEERAIAARREAAGLFVRWRKDGRLDSRCLPEAQARGVSPHFAGLVRLLMLTGCRVREIANARWNDVAWEPVAALHLRDAKAGARSVLLTEAAVVELRRLRELRTASNPWIIEGAKAGSRLVNVAASWARVRARAADLLDERRRAAGLEPFDPVAPSRKRARSSSWPTEPKRRRALPRHKRLSGNPLASLRLHDLRHNVGTQSVAAGDPLSVTASLLGHRSTASTARYAHARPDVVRLAAERVAARIVEAGRGREGAVVEELAPGNAAAADGTTGGGSTSTAGRSSGGAGSTSTTKDKPTTRAASTSGRRGGKGGR